MNSLLALAESGSLGRTCPLGNAFAPPFGCTARPSSSSVGIITAALLGLTFVGSLSAPITTPVALTGRKMFSDEEEGINETSAAFDSSISADRRRSAGSSVGDRNIACSPSTLKNEMLPAVVGRDTVESLNTGPVHEPVRLDCPRGVVPRIEEALPAELEGLVAAL
mmetsp:Transcript_23298/g.58880  ORF Transcript_23298/g.58880 Transcript_23298/m.58880 type:complete len:166 (-) Transcript_23298:3242-3739(-)